MNPDWNKNDDSEKNFYEDMEVNSADMKGLIPVRVNQVSGFPPVYQVHLS